MNNSNSEFITTSIKLLSTTNLAYGELKSHLDTNDILISKYLGEDCAEEFRANMNEIDECLQELKFYMGI